MQRILKAKDQSMSRRHCSSYGRFLEANIDQKPLLTAESTTRMSITMLLQLDTSDSPTAYKYLTTQLHLRPIQEVSKTCSRSPRLAVAKNFQTAESTLSAQHELYTIAWTVYKFSCIFRQIKLGIQNLTFLSVVNLN